MARLLALDDCSVSLRNHLLKSLRSYDEAVLLPQAQREDETGKYKNVVFRIAGAEGDVPVDIFSPEWFSGLSAVRVDPSKVRKILDDPSKREAALACLRDTIPSQMADASITVGPDLDCDDDDRDKTEWTAGFDSPSAFVGLFTAEHSCAPDPGRRGLNRIHQATWLVCKAGSGLAGAMFHSRLVSALKKGATLEEALEKGDPGPRALRRVSLAGSRNRSRILEMAGKALDILCPTRRATAATAARSRRSTSPRTAYAESKTTSTASRTFSTRRAWTRRCRTGWRRSRVRATGW